MISRRQLYAAGEPFGDSCTRKVAGRTTYGGGGGSSQREPTPEERALWQAQGDSLSKMTAIAMPSLATGMNNLGVMANESMDGTLGNRMRGMAGADANQSMSMGLEASRRGLERFGSTFNPNALMAQSNNAAIMGAQNRTNAMNMANFGAEDMKWQRNAALTGLASGQGNSAVSGMGSLAGQIGGSRQAANSADSQSSAGYGQMGMYLGDKMFGKADGGYISRREPEHYAAMGGLQKFQRVDNPQGMNMDFASLGGGNGSGISPMVQGVGMMAAADAVKPVVGDILASAKGNIAGHFQTATGLGGQTGAPVVGANTTPVLNGTTEALASGTTGGTAAGTAATAYNTAGVSGVGASGIPLLEAGTLAGEAGTAAVAAEAGTAAVAAEAGVMGGAAAGAGGAGLSAMIASNPVGWAIGAGLLANELFSADGGPARKNMIPGGPVNGPGTETSDSIPAHLSDGEYVLNAEAVKLIGKKKLDALNKQGLMKRSGKHKGRSKGLGRELALQTGGYIDNDGNYVPYQQAPTTPEEKSPAPKLAPKKTEDSSLDKAKKFFGIGPSERRKALEQTATYGIRG